jgi:membrane associated rhomboid family serine protease
MIPLRDDNPTTHFAWVTLAIIALNVVVFLAWEPILGRHTPEGQELFFFCHAVIPYEVIHHTSLGEGGAPAAQAIAAGFHESLRAADKDQSALRQSCGHKSWLASVFEAMFLHAGWVHIGGNMLFLWVFGNNVEDKLRPARYLLFYLASGIVATAVQVGLIHSGTNDVLPNLGASGAIAGVLGAYLLMFPRRRVLTLVIFFLITVVSIPAFIVLGAWFILQFFNGVLAISNQVNAGGGVAEWAHVGGFAFGMLMAWLFFPKERFGAAPPPGRPDPWGPRRWGRSRGPYGRRPTGAQGGPPEWGGLGYPSPPPRPDQAG